MGTFSARPKISLNLFMSKVDNAGGNSSTVFWDLQINETESQPTYSLDPVSSASVSFSWWNGSTAPAIANYSYDFRPTGLQNKSIGSGSFVVGHQSNGAGGTVSGSASSTANILGTASSSASVALSDYDRSPSWSSFNIPSPVTRGVGYFGQVVANAASSYGVIGGSFPPGLSFNSDGTITGTPNTAGTYSFSFRANGSFEGVVDSSATIVVNTPAPVWQDLTILTTVTRGVAYSADISASDTSSYDTIAGSLPNGLTLNSNGTITGTPTTDGTFSFTVRANGPGGTNTANLSIAVVPPIPGFTDSTVNGVAIVGTPYSDQIIASNATGYSVFSGALPTGVSLNTTTGAIAGTPTIAGVFSFVIRATNSSGGVNTSTLTITVASGARLWNGTTFVSGNTKMWNGTAFVSTTTKVWNGLVWTDAK
jgi:hypothetical protein